MAELVDAMLSLTALMEEETDQLSRPGRIAAHHEIANAKTRLVGRIESELARLGRETPDWMTALDPEPRAELADASRRLSAASKVNAEVLERQIELSSDMMAAIAAEAQRVTGKRSATYGACGGLGGLDIPAPISINTRL